MLKLYLTILLVGKVIIFVGKKTDVEDVAQKLRYRNVDLVVLHGDMHQHERNEAIEAFRSQKPAMVATDVAGSFIRFGFLKFLNL
jgi:ATP-dependent RNA helicase DDX42